jgi:hypothetical protein
MVAARSALVTRRKSVTALISPKSRKNSCFAE